MGDPNRTFHNKTTLHGKMTPELLIKEFEVDRHVYNNLMFVT